MFLQLESEILSLYRSEYLILILVLVVICGYLLYYSYDAFKRFRFIDGTATSKIRSAAQGHVELKGLGEWMPNDLILSPFSNSRCIWYHCTIDKKRRTGKRTTWTNISDEYSHHLFHLVDDTGQCIIDPEKAHVIPETDSTWYGISTEDRLSPPKSVRWLASISLGSYRFRERLIRPATQLYALGWFTSIQNNPADEWIQTQVEDLIQQWKLHPEKHLREFDIDKNGKIEKQEWKAIRTMARKQVLARVNNENQPQYLLTCAEDKRHPYILSAVQEEELVTRKKWKAYLSVGAAFIFFATVVVLFSIRSPINL